MRYPIMRADYGLDDAVSINDLGQIVGTACAYSVPGYGYGVGVAYLLTPVPEPDTFAMLGLGLVALGAVVRRKRRLS